MLRLLTAEPAAVAVLVVAPPGYGKTVLARAICHDARVRAAFANSHQQRFSVNFGEGKRWVVISI